MFEYVSGKIIPGCTYKLEGETPEAVREKAVEHLHEQNGMDYLDNPQIPDLSLADIKVRG